MGVRVKQWKGAWWVFVAHNGQRKAKKIGDQKAAKHVASEIRKRLAAGAFQLPKTGPRFAALAGEWLEKYPLVNAITTNAAKVNADEPAARPSRPSVKLSEFDAA